MTSGEKAARAEIEDILARAFRFDDKPHQLFSGIRAMALRHPSDDTQEIVRLMDEAYAGEWTSFRKTNRGSHAPEPFRCRECNRREGSLHHPVCHRKGTVERDKPTEEEPHA
jgi:hypothetical protein